MNNIRFEDAFPSVPPMVHARVEDTLKEVREMNMKKAKPMVAIVLAAVLALALIGAALAEILGGGVLEYLFGSKESSDELREMVRPIGITHELEGVKTTVTDALFDGRNIHIGFTFDTAQPIFLVTDAISADGMPLWMETSNIENMWVGNPVTGQTEIAARGFSGTLDPAYMGLETAEELAAYEADVAQAQTDGKVEVSLRMTLLVPKGKAITFDPYAGDNVDTWKQIDACVAEGNTPIDASEPYDVLVSSAWLGDEYYDGISAGQHPLNDVNAYVDYSNMKVLDSFQLTFTLDVDQSHSLDRTPKDSLNDGRTHIAFGEISFTPLCSTFDFTITPDGMTMEEIEATYRWFTFYAVNEGEDRTPIAFDDIYYLCDSGPEEQADGSLALHAHYRMPGIKELPAVIAIVPYNENSSAEDPLWEYAIYCQGRQ